MPAKGSAMAASDGTFKKTGGLGITKLQGSRGAPLMMDATLRSEGQSQKPSSGDGLTMPQLMLFVFPSSLEHPESTGRLELFARYGPVDQAGNLRGGISGSHVHSNLEIRNMIHHETREMLFALFKKPRETVEVIVDGLMPAAMAYNYTLPEVKQLLKPCFGENGKLKFNQAQQIILDTQKARLQALLKDGNALKKERGPRVPFQSKTAEMLLAPIQKKQLNQQEEQQFRKQRLHKFCTVVAGLEDQNLQQQLLANVTLCRHLGDTDDRWDRYCALRRVGKATYVQARNIPHAGAGCMDDGLADKHAGVSSLVSTGYSKGVIL